MFDVSTLTNTRTNVPIGTIGTIHFDPLRHPIMFECGSLGCVHTICVCTESTRRWEVSFQFNPINVVPFGTEMKSFVTIG